MKFLLRSTATVLASRGWPAPDPARPLLRAGAILGALSLSFTPSLSDVVHLKGGRAVQVESCVREKEELRCRVGSGTVGFPLDQVESVDRSTRALKRIPPPGAAGQAVREGSVAHEPVEPPRLGLLSRDEALARIRELASAPQPASLSTRRESALLHAYAAGLFVEEGANEEAEMHYRTSLELAPSLLIARLNLATLLINLGRYDQAHTLLHDTLSEHPTSARAFFLLGEIAMQQGREEEAIDAWQRSLELRPGTDLLERMERARRLLAAERGFLTSEAMHFRLKFDEEKASEELAREILGFLEQSYTDLSSRLSHAPQGPIQVTLYSRESFHRATETPDWVGGLFDGEMRVPIGGLSSLTSPVRRVLLHELSHSFLTSQSAGRAPRWVQEGFAQVMEGLNGRRDRERLARACSASGAEACTAELLYPAALSRVEFFLERWSQVRFNALLDHLARGHDIDASMREATGLRHAEFQDAWLAWLAPNN